MARYLRAREANVIQDIYPHELHNEMRFTTPADDDFVLVYRDRTAGSPYNSVLIRQNKDGSIQFPTYSEVQTDWPLVYVFSVDDKRFFLARSEKDVEKSDPPEVDGYEYVRMFTLRNAIPRAMAYAGVVGFHLHLWYRDNVYCGRCGKRLSYSHTERALECRSCGNVVYPKIAPAVIVAVVDGDRLLLTKYAGREYRERALVAGFTEIGETAEETVAREVLEETGVHVKNIRYYRSQPWGFAENLLLGFFCELDGDPTITMQEDELGYAQWVPREEIFEEDDHVSLTREMIMRFKHGDPPRM